MKQLFALFAPVLNPRCSVVPTAAAGKRSTEQVVSHHNQAMSARHLDQIMDDYADNAILMDPSGVCKGKASIRKHFEGLLSNPHIVFAPPARQLFENELAHLIWSPEPGTPGREAAETIIVRDGKIVAQTVAIFGMPHRASK